MNLESVKEEAREIFIEFTNGMCEALALGRKKTMSVIDDAMRLNWLWGMIQGITITVRRNITPYGALYNWFAVTDARGLAPIGWHLPSLDEWLQLANYVGVTPNIHSGDLREVGTEFWDAPNTGATNIYGFNGRASGERSGGDGGYINMGNSLLGWLGNEFPGAEATSAQRWAISSLFSLISPADSVLLSGSNKTSGLAVRYLKDDGVYVSKVKGNDLKEYSTVKIGNQIWMSENSVETMFRNLDDLPIISDNSTWVATQTPSMCYYNNIAPIVISPIADANGYDPLDDSPALAIEKLRHYRGIYKDIDLSQIGVISNPSSPSTPTGQYSDLIRSGEQVAVFGANVIVFSSPLSTSNYTVNVWIIGINESQYDLGTITKATTGFTVSDAVIEGTLYYQVIVVI